MWSRLLLVMYRRLGEGEARVSAVQADLLGAARAAIEGVSS